VNLRSNCKFPLSVFLNRHRAFVFIPSKRKTRPELQKKCAKLKEGDLSGCRGLRPVYEKQLEFRR
jgi:hypothetical protein